jgi:hypothetical protein
MRDELEGECPYRTTTLKLEYGYYGYGDASTTQTIPAGRGFTTLSFSHAFAGPGNVTLIQRATILETGLRAVALTVHVEPPPENYPASSDPSPL